MFKFITGKPLWVNILAAIVMFAILVLLFLYSLNFFTQHGKVMKIPAVAGKSYAEAKKMLESEGFDVEIQDSVYIDTLLPLAVVKQFPEADELVKINRTVYVTVNRSVAPTIEMPNLVGMSFRNAELILKQYGLKIGDTTFKPDFAKNSILSMQVNGVEIKPSTKIPMGSLIDLVIGSGLADVDMGVPNLFGLTYSEAKIAVEASGLSFSVVLPDANVKDTANAFVYKQSPEMLTEDKKINRIRQGQMIDVWLSVDKPLRQDSIIQTPDLIPQ